MSEFKFPLENTKVKPVFQAMESTRCEKGPNDNVASTTVLATPLR